MKRIRLYAYYASNLGDDLMVDIILRRYPDCRFWVNSDVPHLQKFRHYPNFKDRLDVFRKYGRRNRICNLLTFHRKEDFLLHRQFKKEAKKCDCGVYIGGSLYMQDVNDTVEHRIKEEERRFATGPLFVIGANFGPYHTPEFREGFSGYFAKCAGVTFRDQASYRLFDQLPNTAYAPDVVFNLQPPQGAKQENTVVISVIDMPSRKALAGYAQAYEAFIGSFCRVCVERGKKPVLMSFCQAEGDCRAIKRIRDALERSVREQTGVYEYKENMQEALGVIAGAEFVLATRFHAMILALRMGKPFFCVCYSDKIKWVLDDLSCTAYRSVRELEGLDPNEILDTYTQPVDVDAYMQEAQRQFEQLDRYLNDEQK